MQDKKRALPTNRRVTLKFTALLTLITLLSVTAVLAQPDEETAPAEDSLQVDEETGVIQELPAEGTETVTDVTEEVSAEDSEPTEEDQVEAETEVVIPGQPTAVLESFFLALKNGDSYMVSQLISQDGLEAVGVMLDALKENLDNDPDGVMARLTAAGYSATIDEVEDWSAIEYLSATVELPVMKARYAMYEMRVNDFSVNGDRLQVPITFITSSGVELPFQAEMVKVRNDWRVSTFMGLSSFP
jgi:hypothetical protein